MPNPRPADVPGGDPPPAATRRAPVVSRTPDDAILPGVLVEVDADAAERMGAFEETALSEADAWDANADLQGDLFADLPGAEPGARRGG